MAIVKVTYRFLDGNLCPAGDPITEEQEDDLGNTYAAAMEEALRAEYPGAEVEVEHERRTSGSVPRGAIDVESDAEGSSAEYHEVSDAEFRVQHISEETYERTYEEWAARNL